MMSEPLGEVGANISPQLSSRTYLTIINTKKVITENQCEKHKKLEFSTYVDFSRDQQGRLVHARTVVAAQCIKI